MKDFRIIFGIGFLFVTAGLIGLFLLEPKSNDNKINEPTVMPEQKQQIKQPATVKKESAAIKSDLYSGALYDIPLSAIADIAELQPEVKQKIDDLLESSQGFYFLKHSDKSGEIIILLQNPAKDNGNYTRHNLQLAIINNDRKVSYKNLGYSGEEGEIESVAAQKTDKWDFDTTVEPYRPIKHTSYDKHKKIIFTETWNYNENEPFKYVMTDSNNNIVSLIKENVNGESNYTKEHIFYDKDGNIIKNISECYEGAYIKTFKYYDKDFAENNIFIENEYTDGYKSIEKIYNNEFKLIKILKSEYEYGNRTAITVYDSEGNEVKKYITAN